MATTQFSQDGKRIHAGAGCVCKSGQENYQPDTKLCPECISTKYHSGVDAMILFIALLALCLARVQYMATKFNQNARWNGRGAIPSVLDRSAKAPMAYRVLAAWTIGRRVNLYQPFQFFLIWIALYSVWLAWGLNVLLITSILLVATFWYDYFSNWSELIGLSLALVSFPLALLGVAIHGLSRETAPLCGLAYALHSGDWLGGCIISAVGFVV